MLNGESPLKVLFCPDLDLKFCLGNHTSFISGQQSRLLHLSWAQFLFQTHGQVPLWVQDSTCSLFVLDLLCELQVSHANGELEQFQGGKLEVVKVWFPVVFSWTTDPLRECGRDGGVFLASVQFPWRGLLYLGHNSWTWKRLEMLLWGNDMLNA